MAKKLLDIMRDKIRLKHYSIKTEQSYIGWAKRYIFFHNKRHPKEMRPLKIPCQSDSVPYTSGETNERNNKPTATSNSKVRL